MNHNHQEGQKCFACEHGKEAMEKFEKDSIEKYGWYTHFITDEDDSSPTGFNAHTHHLMESYGHPDLQIVIPMEPQLVSYIFHNAVNEYIKKGIPLEVGKEYKNIIGNGYSITVIKVKETDDREVLRIIFPDKYGYLQKTEPMDERYLIQYEGEIE